MPATSSCRQASVNALRAITEHALGLLTLSSRGQCAKGVEYYM